MQSHRNQVKPCLLPIKSFLEIPELVKYANEKKAIYAQLDQITDQSKSDKIAKVEQDFREHEFAEIARECDY